MRNDLIPTGILLVLLSWMPIAGAADAIYRYEVKLPSETETQNMDVSVGNNNISITGYQDAEMIYRGQEQQLVGIDHIEKSYFVLDLQTVKSLALTVSVALDRIRKQIETLPEDQREMIEAQLQEQFGITDGGPPAVLEIRNANRSGDAAGVQCDWWEVLEDGELIREVCSADPSDLPAGDQSLEIMMGLGRLQEEIYDEMAETVPIELPDNPFALLEEMNGLPVISNGMNSRHDEGSMKLVSARETALPAETFKPPEDYQKQKLDFGN